jgi:hypothetical protein
MAEPALPVLQLWLQDAILAGGAAPGPAGRIVAGDERLPAGERIAIYARAYRARLIECLRGEYPALRLLVGDTVFDLFAGGYLAACPPTHFSLHELGARFADHLTATRPPGEEQAGAPTALPAALARLERARAEVQRAKGVEGRAGPLVSGDAALLPGARLRLPDNVRLLRLDFDFLPLIEAAEAGAAAIVPEARPTPTVVTRTGYRLRMLAPEPWRFAWLEALGSGVEDVQAAAAMAARASGRDGGALLADLALWIPAAAALGLVIPA